MRSLEYKPQKTLMVDGPMMPSYPTLHVNEDQLPEFSKWKTGEEYTMKVKVRVASQETYGEEGDKICGRLDFLAYSTKEDDTEAEKNLD